MPTNSTPSLPTSPSPTRKTFSSQHNVWNKLLFRAERRAPQTESHLYLPRDPGDDHLRASLENYLINHQLQIDAVFRIPVREPSRPKRKAAKRCRPRQSTPRVQQSRAPYVVHRIEADDEESDVVVVPKVPVLTVPSTNRNDDYIIRRKKSSKPSESRSDIPLSQRLRNDRALYSELNPKPPSLLVPPQQHAPERSRRRVSKTTPLSTMHNALSSLEPSEDSPTLYSCDSRAVASRIESTTNAVIDNSSIEIVPVVCSQGTRIKSKRTRHNSKKPKGSSSLDRTTHGSNEQETLRLLSISSSSDKDEIWAPKVVAASSERAYDFVEPKGYGSLERVKQGSKRDAAFMDIDSDIGSSSEGESGRKAVRERPKQTKCDSKNPKGRGSLEKLKQSSNRDAAFRNSDCHFDIGSASELEVSRAELVEAKPRRTKRNSEKPKVRESSKRTACGLKNDAAEDGAGTFLSSEDDVSGSLAHVARPGRAKRDLNKSKRRGNEKKRKLRSKRDTPLGLLSLTSSSDDEVSGPEDVAYRRRGFAFRKSVRNLSQTREYKDGQNGSEDGIVVLPPDRGEMYRTPCESASFDLCQVNDGKDRNEAFPKHGDEDVRSRPPRLQRVGRERTNKRAERNSSLSPVPTQCGHTSRAAPKNGRCTNLPKPSVISSELPNMSSKECWDLQPTEIVGNKNPKIHSEIMNEVLLPVQDNGHRVLSPDVEIDDSIDGGNSEVAIDTALPGSSGCEKEGSRKGPCGSQEFPKDCVLLKDGRMQELNATKTPSYIGRRQVTIPLTLRIRQPRPTHLGQNLEKKRETCGVRRKEKSKNIWKPVPVEKGTKGAIDEHKNGPERLSIPFDKATHQSSSARERATTNIQRGIHLANELKISTSSPRYSLRSCKQGSERNSDVRLGMKGARKREGRKSYNVNCLSLKSGAKTHESCEPSLSNQRIALSPPASFRSDVNEVCELEISRSSDDGDIEAKNLCTGLPSPSRERPKITKKDLSPKWSSSRRPRERVSTRAKRRRVRGERSSKRFDLTASDVAFGPFKSLRKRGRGRSSSKLFS